MQIQKLEDELGVLLFDRTKHPVAVTENGERILKQAKIILQESNRLQNIVDEIRKKFPFLEDIKLI